MSNAVASARKRRAGVLPDTPQVNSYSQNNQMQNIPQPPGTPQGLTLQQVISLINTRLLKLEKFMNDSSTVQNSERRAIEHNTDEVQVSSDAIMDQLQQLVDEYNLRFNVFSEEISKLKDTIMSLQTFTMEVNKSLYQERIQILSDIGDSKDTFVLNEQNENIKLESEEENQEN